MLNFRMVSLVVIALSLTACASMSEEECLTSDWRAVGYEDGLQGKSGATIGVYRKACAKAGVAPDFDQYQLGRDEGLRQFCRPQNGFRYGEQGGNYRNVCPADMEPALLAAFDDGRTLYNFRADVSRLERQVNNTGNRIDKLEHEMEAATLAMLADGITQQQRLAILADTRAMAEERGELKDELEHLIFELGASRQRLSDYEAEQFASY